MAPDEKSPAPCGRVSAPDGGVPVLDEECSTPCGSVLAYDDGVAVPDEESSSPFDHFSSSRRFSAFSCSLSWICAAGSLADVASSTPD